jgi:hypothetical protein
VEELTKRSDQGGREAVKANRAAARECEKSEGGEGMVFAYELPPGCELRVVVIQGMVRHCWGMFGRIG